MVSRAARVAVLPSALLLCLVAAPAAHAQTLSVEDPAGDAANGKLDITGATIHNRDYRLVATVTLAEMEKGSVIVSVDRRHGTGVRLVSTRRADGTVHGRVLAGAFTDGDLDGGAVACKKFRSVWDDDAGTVTLRMPSACWNGGDYGAVRFAVLTEKRGADQDAAPTTDDGEITSSAWVARG
jgi:hypothetical protein